MVRILPALLLFGLFSNRSLAQSSASSVSFKIERTRLLWHDKVDREQKNLLKLDGKEDDGINISRDETVNMQIEYALIKGVDDTQARIELDSTLNNNGKLKYLLGLESLLKGYNANFKRRDFPVTIAQSLIEAFDEGMVLDRKGQSIEPIVAQNNYAVGKIMTECYCFKENPGVNPSRSILMRKYLAMHPTETLAILKTNLAVPFADSLIKAAALRSPQQVYDFAAARDALGAKIRSNPDQFVKTISTMANSKSGQLYFPFIDKLAKGEISFQEIDSVKNNNLNYFRLLVKTRIEYAGRIALKRDTPMGMRSITERMTYKAKEEFIRTVNGLHTENDNVRFKSLEPLTPQELYYLCVLGEDEIYTSSYLGVFKRIFQKMKVPRGDSLVMSVNGDYFRKFVKLAAAYNTLDTLLKSMPAESATSLMRAFMIGLEKSTTPDNAEDAVDVADSYSSIVEKNKTLAAFMLNEARWNYERCVKNQNKNGQVIYNLEKTLFESADSASSGGANLSEELGIPPVYSVDYTTLLDDSGRVVQQVFFYGDEDKDGQTSYANYLSLFRGKDGWAITDNNPDWVTIKSTKGKPVWIFANKPLYGPEDPDAKAQAKLGEYLAERNIKPTIYIHRGHSYHVKYSLQQIQSSARIVVLGSCGGYNNLNEVLSISNDAHIISSKQVGTKTVNEPILAAINNTVRSGKNVEWIPMWRELSKLFTGEGKERFEDYIPPYKNLGAIFIKAYRNALGE